MALVVGVTCVVPECERRVVARGACENHYRRWLTGDTTIPVHRHRHHLSLSDNPLDQMNPWRHRAPECPEGHGRDYCLPIDEARGFWRCIGLPGQRNGHYVQVAVADEAVA